MSIPLFEEVILLQDLPEDDLLAGDVGTIVEEHNVPNLETGYSVEFFDMLGNTVAVATVPQSYLRRPTERDRPMVRHAVFS